MRVTLVSPDGYTYPKTCPCCSGPASELETITGSAKEGQGKTKLSLKMPACNNCLDHRSVGKREAMFLILIGALGLVAALLGKFVFESDTIVNVGIGVCVLTLIAAPLVERMLRKSWPDQNPRHANVGPAVRVRPYFGEVIFDFDNEDFGNAFKDMNKTRLAKTT